MALASAGGGGGYQWKNKPQNVAVTGAGLDVPKSGYGSFIKNTGNQAANYLGGNALKNPWAGIKNPYDQSTFLGMGNDLYKRMFANGNPWGGGDGGSGGSSWGYGDPNSQTLKGHLANLIGGTRQIATQAGQNAAYAGPNRAGTGVVGGGDPRSIAAYNTAKAISEDYGNQYGRAADLTLRGESEAGNRWNSSASLLASLMGNVLGAQQGEGQFLLGKSGGEGQFLLGQAGIGRDLNAQQLQGVQGEADDSWRKYQDAVNWQRGAEDRSRAKTRFNNEQQDRQMQLGAAREKERQSEIDKYLVQRQAWRGQGGGWLDSGAAGDAAMRLARDEGRDWWVKNAGGGGAQNPETRKYDFSKVAGYK